MATVNERRARAQADPVAYLAQTARQLEMAARDLRMFCIDHGAASDMSSVAALLEALAPVVWANIMFDSERVDALDALVGLLAGDDE
jgi:hypothetical protein